MKKIVFVALIFVLLVVFSACGLNPEWKYEESTHTLFINSDSVMIAYEPDLPNEGTTSNAPWAEYLPEIENIVVGDSVTKISDYALAFCGSLKNVTVGKNVASLGVRCFYRCGDWNNKSEMTMTFNCSALPAFGNNDDVFGWTWDNPNVIVYVPADLQPDWSGALIGHSMKVVALD